MLLHLKISSSFQLIFCRLVHKSFIAFEPFIVLDLSDFS